MRKLDELGLRVARDACLSAAAGCDMLNPVGLLQMAVLRYGLRQIVMHRPL